MAEAENLKNQKKEEGREMNRAWWQPAIAMFLRLSVWIAAPIIIALYLGKWLDKRYDTAPWLFLSCIGLAFIISIFGLIKNTLKEFKKLEKDGKNKP